MWLGSEHLGAAESEPLPSGLCVASGPLSHACLCADLQLTCDKDEEHSMCQNARVSFYYHCLLPPAVPSVDWLCAWANCVYVGDHNTCQAELQ